MNKKRVFLTALALVLILSLSIGSALAYFYTSDDSVGENKLELGAKTTIKEDYSEGVKTITITNDESSKQAVFVRAKAYGTPAPTYGTQWGAPVDGYYYYPGVLEPGQSTNPSLTVKVNFPGEPTPKNIGETFNVIVVYEAVPAMYKEDGTPYASSYADAWNQTIKPAT